MLVRLKKKAGVAGTICDQEAQITVDAEMEGWRVQRAQFESLGMCINSNIFNWGCLLLVMMCSRED